MRVLIVGAGHVGQAYGHYLHEGGAELSYFVRESARARAERGFVIHPLREGGLPLRLRDYDILTSWEEVSRRRWDYILLAVPSEALREGWLERMLESTGEAPVITVRHAIGDLRLMTKKLGGRCQIRALTSFFAFDHPLGAPKDAQGTAIWAFPMSQVLFDAPDAASVATLLRTLRRAKLPCRFVRDASVMVGTGEFLLMALSMMFELCDWSLDEAGRRLPDVRLALAASREMSEILEAEEGLPPPAFRGLLRPRLALFLVRSFDAGMPFSLSAFVRAHYSKLRAQGERDRRVSVETGQRLGLSVDAILEVRRRFGEGASSRAA